VQLNDSPGVLGVQALDEASVEDGAPFPLGGCLLVRLAKVKVKVKLDGGEGGVGKKLSFIAVEM